MIFANLLRRLLGTVLSWTSLFNCYYYYYYYYHWYEMFFSYSHLLLPGIRREQTIFLSDLRFFVQWFHGSMVQSICDCSAVQSAVYSSKCLAAAPVFLLGRTCHFVLLSCKICAEIVVDRMFAVFLNGLNDKNSSRSIVRNICHRDRFIL